MNSLVLDFAAGFRAGIRPFGNAFAHLAAVAGICSVLMLLGFSLLIGSQHLTGLVSTGIWIVGEAVLVIGAMVLLFGTMIVLGRLMQVLIKGQA